MVRISGGRLRGRRLDVPAGIRPTTGLARKAAFDILGGSVIGARILDACAGSGAYGLEALSRGAEHATFVESNREVAKVLRGNIEQLGAGRAARVEEMSVARFSSKGEEGREPALHSFDVIFHDPPFEANSEGDLQILLGMMSAGAWLFHERGDDRTFSPGGIEPSDRRRYGSTRFLVFRPGGR